MAPAAFSGGGGGSVPNDDGSEADVGAAVDDGRKRGDELGGGEGDDIR